MRRKLMGISALTCLLGGSMLLAPATAQSTDPDCESLVGRRCTGGIQRCTPDWGGTEYLQCFNGTWHWA